MHEKSETNRTKTKKMIIKKIKKETIFKQKYKKYATKRNITQLRNKSNNKEK